MNFYKWISISLLGLLTLPSPSLAQTARTVCGQRDQIIETLTGRFGETPRSWGMVPNNRIIEVFTSEETGSWTITVTAPNGQTCLLAAGLYWEEIAPQPAGESM